MGKKSHSNWPLIIGGAAVAGLALVGLSQHAKAAAAPFEPYEDPSLTKLQAAKAMTDKLHALLTAKGFAVSPAYVTDVSATESIIPNSTLTQGRNLAAENQTGYETFYHFMWDSNGILKFNNYDVNDASKWATFTSDYNQALAYINAL